MRALIRQLRRALARPRPLRATSGGETFNRSGTIAVGGAAQTLAAANINRSYLLVVNVSTDQLWIDFEATAAAAPPSIPLAAASAPNTPGGFWESGSGWVPRGRVSIVGPNAGAAFVAKEG